MKRGKISDNDKADMKNAFNVQKMSPEDIAKKFDRSLDLIIKILRIKSSYAKAPAKAIVVKDEVTLLDFKRGRIGDAEKAEILEQAKTLSAEEIAKKHNRNPKTITNLIGTKPATLETTPEEISPEEIATNATTELNDDQVLDAVRRVEEPLKRGVISDDDQAEIQEAYNIHKMSPEDIATKYGRTLEAVLKVLHIKNYQPVVAPPADPVGFGTQKEYVEFIEDAVQSLLLERGMNNDIAIPHYKNPDKKFNRANILAQIDAARLDRK